MMDRHARPVWAAVLMVALAGCTSDPGSSDARHAETRVPSRRRSPARSVARPRPRKRVRPSRPRRSPTSARTRSPEGGSRSSKRSWTTWRATERDGGHRDDRRRHVERGGGQGGRRSRRSGRQSVRHREHHQVGDRRPGDADGRGRRARASTTRPPTTSPRTSTSIRTERRSASCSAMRRGIPDWYGDEMEERGGDASTATAGRRPSSWRWSAADRAPAGEDVRVHRHQLHPARTRRSSTCAGDRSSRCCATASSTSRGRSGSSTSPMRPRPTDGHAGGRVARRARGGRRLPPVPLRCELRRAGGRHGVRLALPRALVAGVLRRRDRLRGLADRDVDVRRRPRRVRTRAVQPVADPYAVASGMPAATSATCRGPDACPRTARSSSS